MNTNADTAAGPDPHQPAVPGSPPASEPAEPPARAADGAWLGTPSGIVALVALVLSIFLPPLFFPLAGLALVLGIVALVRRRPRPRSAVVVVVISGVLILVLLVVGILASLALLTTEVGTPG